MALEYAENMHGRTSEERWDVGLSGGEGIGGISSFISVSVGLGWVGWLLGWLVNREGRWDDGPEDSGVLVVLCCVVLCCMCV